MAGMLAEGVPWTFLLHVAPPLLRAARRAVASHLLCAPALMVEYLGGGSVRSCLKRSSDVLRPALARVKIALDAARVCALTRGT